MNVLKLTRTTINQVIPRSKTTRQFLVGMKKRKARLATGQNKNLFSKFLISNTFRLVFRAFKFLCGALF